MITVDHIITTVLEDWYNKVMHKYHNKHAFLHKVYMWFGKNQFGMLKWSKNFFDWAAAPTAPSKYARSS